MKHLTNPQKRRGISTLWTVLTFMVIVAIIGLMLDWAYVFVTGSQLQNAADAAALAGSRVVPVSTYDGARQEAQDYANLNDAAKEIVNLGPVDDTSDVIAYDMARPPEDILNMFKNADVYIGRYLDDSRTFIRNDDSPDAMMVITRKTATGANPPLALLFAPIVTTFFGGDKVENAGIQKYAVAKIKNPYGAGVLALGECCCPGIIFGSGVGELTVLNGGSLYVNSRYGDPDYCPVTGNTGAIDQSGNSDSELDLDRIYTCGSIDPFFDNPELADVHDYQDDIDPEPDPYASVPDAVPGVSEDYDIGNDLGTITAPGTYYPGYYSGGIQITDTGTTVTLEPGNYYLDSVGQSASLYMNGGLVTGEGVTLHIIGDADDGIYIGGSADMDISAPTSGDYADIAIFEKRDPNYACEQSCTEPWDKADPISTFTGNGTILIDGAVYMPHNRFELGGTGYIEMTRTIADRFYIYGTGDKVVNYNGEPKVATRSYLVE